MQFPNFYGNEGLKARLSATMDRGGFSHCYILEGPQGSGKKTLSRILAAAMECEGTGAVPCGVCPACHKIFGGGHPDVITVDSDTATVPIRVIREMQADAYIQPNEGKRKIYLLPRAQDMQLPAQNALLKLLEEPPSYCTFLLMTDNLEKLLPTVRSRAVVLTLSPLDPQTLTGALKASAPTATQEAIASAVEKSEGYLGAALRLLDAPDTALDQQAAAFLEALASQDDLRLLQVLIPLEKAKRQDLLHLLGQLYRSVTRAMEPTSLKTKELQLLSTSCTGPQLFSAAKAISQAITLLQANGSSGHAVGVLMAQLRS
jgi:DNA polymerase-3 subunit delta'